MLILMNAPALINACCLFSEHNVRLTCMNSCWFIGCCSSLTWDLFLKERICKFFPVRGDPTEKEAKIVELLPL